MTDAEEDTQVITLVSMDNQKYEIPLDAARGSQHLVHFMEGGDPSQPLPLPTIKGHVLEKVIEYLKQYRRKKPREIARPLAALPFNQLIDDWDYKYISIEQRLIFELILAANYMDIPGLLDLCCAKVASEIRNKPVEEIRKTFGIENDFTPEEEAQIREENKWCEPE